MSLKCIDFLYVIKYIIVNDCFVICVGSSLLSKTVDVTVQTTTDNHEDVSILEEDSLQIIAHLDNVLVHMIGNQQTAIFKSNQDFNKSKEKILQYIKYAENWQVASVMCSYTVISS